MKKTIPQLLTDIPLLEDTVVSLGDEIKARDLKIQNLYETIENQIRDREHEIKTRDLEIERLNETIKSLLNRSFGRKSEKVDPSYFDEPSLEGCKEDDLTKADEELITVTYQPRKSGRKPLPEILTRKTITHDIPEPDKYCSCGAALELMGAEKSEQIGIIPAQVYVIEHVRPKYVCKCCETGFKIAPMPSLPIPKSIASSGLLAHMIVSKYEDHLPLYRQEKIWQRLGVEIPRASMSLWVFKCAALLSPLRDLLKRRIVCGNYAKADETPITVLEREGVRGSFNGYIWVFTSGLAENRSSVFEYHASREGKVAEHFFQGFKGVLQSDGYSGYNRLRAHADIQSAGCMQHCRRKFVEVLKISNQKPGAASQVKVLELFKPNSLSGIP
jgi:transposase